MTYKEAMENYGSDKPDTRFDIKIVNCSDIFANSTFKVFSDALAVEIGPIRGSVRAINAKGLSSGFSRKDLDATVEYAKTLGAKGLCWMNWPVGGEIKSSIAKFLTEEDIANVKERMNFEEGDVIFLAADKDYVVFNTLGGIRLYVADKFNLIDKNRYDILWVTEFPMFEWSEEENRFMAVHHPFTSPTQVGLYNQVFYNLQAEHTAFRMPSGEDHAPFRVILHQRISQPLSYRSKDRNQTLSSPPYFIFVFAFTHNTIVSSDGLGSDLTKTVAEALYKFGLIKVVRCDRAYEDGEIRVDLRALRRHDAFCIFLEDLLADTGIQIIVNDLHNVVIHIVYVGFKAAILNARVMHKTVAL